MEKPGNLEIPAQMVQGPKPLPRKTKLLTAAAVFYGNIGLALVCHVHGPALTSFQKKYKTNDATISIVFSLMTAGISAGALLSGFLFRFVNRQLALIFFFGGMGICMFAIPFCPEIYSFFVVSTVMGIFGGFYAAAQFTWILEMMQSECPPYVIAEHFFYALGIVISSLLLAPFLDKGEGGIVLLASEGDNSTTSGIHKLSEKEAYHHEGQEEEGNKLIIPFTVMAIILELSMVFQIILYKFYRYHPPPPEESTTEQRNNDELDQEATRKASVASITSLEKRQAIRHRDSITSASLPFKQSKVDEVGERRNSLVKRLLLIIYLGVFCGSFKGMEDNVVAFLPKYAQNGPLHMSESHSAYLLSASMFAYTISRFLGIFVVYKVPPRAVLCVNIALTIICNCLLMTYARTSETVLWVTAVLFGVAFSTAYGCFSSYLERFLHVTDAVGAWVLLYGSGIAAVYPVIIGHYIEWHPIVLPYVCWFSIVLCSLIFLISSIQTRLDKNKY